MAKQDGIYGYSSPKTRTPNLRLTLELEKGSGIWVTCTRIRGTGKPPRRCWLSGVDYLLYKIAFDQLSIEWARTHPRSWEAAPRVLVAERGGWNAYETRVRWIAPADGRGRGPQPTRPRRHLRIIPKPRHRSAHA